MLPHLNKSTIIKSHSTEVPAVFRKVQGWGKTLSESGRAVLDVIAGEAQLCSTRDQAQPQPEPNAVVPGGLLLRHGWPMGGPTWEIRRMETETPTH